MVISKQATILIKQLRQLHKFWRFWNELLYKLIILLN